MCFLRLYGYAKILLSTYKLTVDYDSLLWGNFTIKSDIDGAGAQSEKKTISGSDLPYRDWETDRKSTRLNSSHLKLSRMPSSA